MAFFMELPRDVLLAVLCYLDAKSLMALMQVGTHMLLSKRLTLKRLLQTCKSLFGLYDDKQAWLQATQRIISIHDLRIGPMDFTSLTIDELRRLATKPYRFERRVRDATLAENNPRLFRFSEEVMFQELVPGGRWLITAEVGEGQDVSLKLYDLNSLDALSPTRSPPKISPVKKVPLEIQYSSLLQMNIGSGDEGNVCVLLVARA